MIVQCHWVCNNFKTFVKGSVMFAVDVFQSVGIAGTCYRVSAVITFTCAVNFKFDTEISFAFAVEYGRGFVVIIVDGSAVIMSGIAVGTEGFIIVIVGIISVDNPIAVGTACVVVVIW